MTNRYPDGVGLHGTYKTNSEKLVLCQIVVIDMNCMGIPICFAFIRQQTSVINRVTAFLQTSQYILIQNCFAKNTGYYTFNPHSETFTVFGTVTSEN